MGVRSSWDILAKNSDFSRLARALKSRAGADRIDADFRSKSARRNLRKIPERHLGEAVGRELGRHFQDALIDHVDHDRVVLTLVKRTVAFRLGRLSGKRLGQEDRRAQVAVDMPVPAFGRRRGQRIVFEDRGVVHKDAQHAERVCGTRNKRIHLFWVKQVCVKRDRLTVHGTDIVRHSLGRIGLRVVVDRHVMTHLR